MTEPAASSSSRGKTWGLVAIVLLALGLGVWLWSKRDAASESNAEAKAGPSDRLTKLGKAGEADRKGLQVPKLEREAKAAITGTVRTRGGGPIANAQICVTADPSELRGLGDGRPICTRSEHDGHYRIEGLWPVPVDVDASAPEHRPARWKRPGNFLNWRPQLHLRPGEVREGVDLELRHGGTKLGGVIKDISGGEIEGALVTVRGGEWGQGPKAIGTSDADGRFEIWTEPGAVEIQALAAGYAASSTSAFSPSNTVELFLTPESILVGQVVHAETGEPIADVTVTAGGNAFDFDSDAVRSDADGNFRIVGLPPGIYKPVAQGEPSRGVAEGRSVYGIASTQVHLGLGQTSKPVEIRVHSAALIEGRVVKAGTDEGCPEAWVTLTHVETKERHYGGGDPDGHVLIRGVLPGEYEVVVDCLGMVGEVDYPKLEVAEANLVDQVWEVREGLAIRGEIVDAEGNPVADMQVVARMQVDASNARGQVTQSFSPETEEDGAFEIPGLLAGGYELAAWGERPVAEEPIIVTLESGADRNDVRIELPATGSVRGRVVDERGAGQANVAVEAGLIGGGWRRANTRTDDAGNFTLEHVRVGEVRVQASTDRWGDTLRRPGTSDDDVQGEVVSIAANAVTEVELIIESRSGAIRGHVFDETGAPVDDAFVHAERMSDSATANKARSRNAVRWDWNSTPHLSEPDGSFEIGDLSEGSYVVRAYRKGGGEAIAEDVVVGSSVDLTIVPTGVLAGVVRVEGGPPPERFTISARDNGRGLNASDHYFRTDGRWELRELSAGTYTINVDSSAGNGELIVELESGAVEDKLEIVLQPRVTIKGRLIDSSTREPVPGMRVTVQARGGSWMFSGDGKPGPEVSDEQGNFMVENAATGRVRLAIMPRTFNETSGYSWTMLNRTLEPEPKVQDFGDIPLIRDRLEPGQAAGDLGFELQQTDPNLEAEELRLTVGLIRPGGPAEASGLAVGDVIEAVDGTGVLGLDATLYWKLTRVPEGTVIELTIAGGKSVKITAGPPRE